MRGKKNLQMDVKSVYRQLLFNAPHPRCEHPIKKKPYVCVCMGVARAVPGLVWYITPPPPPPPPPPPIQESLQIDEDTSFTLQSVFRQVRASTRVILRAKMKMHTCMKIGDNIR